MVQQQWTIAEFVLECLCVCVCCFEWFAVCTCLHLLMLERWRCDIERIWHTDVHSISFRLTWFRGAGKLPARSTHIYCVLLQLSYILHVLTSYDIDDQCRANCIRDHSERLYTCHVHLFVTILSCSHNTCLHVIQDQIISTSDMLSPFILNQSWTRNEGHRELSQDGC